jgi:hypothetical protein
MIQLHVGLCLAPGSVFNKKISHYTLYIPNKCEPISQSETFDSEERIQIGMATQFVDEL